MRSLDKLLVAATLWAAACGAAYAVASNPDAVEWFYRDTVKPFLQWDWKPAPAPVGENLEVQYRGQPKLG